MQRLGRVGTSGVARHLGERGGEMILTLFAFLARVGWGEGGVRRFKEFERSVRVSQTPAGLLAKDSLMMDSTANQMGSCIAAEPVTAMDRNEISNRTLGENPSLKSASRQKWARCSVCFVHADPRLS